MEQYILIFANLHPFSLASEAITDVVTHIVTYIVGYTTHFCFISTYIRCKAFFPTQKYSNYLLPMTYKYTYYIQIDTYYIIGYRYR